jgi:O-antigen/teichoic acid export membrane protein
MSVSKKLAMNSVVQIGGKILSMVIGLVTIKILTVQLGVSGFGGYTTILNFLLIFGILADLGLYIVLTQEIATDDKEKNNHDVSNIFTLRAVSAISSIVIIGSLIGLLTNYDPEIKRLIALGGFGMVFMSMAQVFVGVFQTHLRTDYIVVGEVISRLTLMLGVITLSTLGYFSLANVIYIFVFSNFLQFAYTWFGVKKYYQVKPDFDLGYWKYLLGQSLPLFIVIAFNLVYYKIDTLMLSLLQSQEAVGYYGVSYKILEILAVFPGMLVGLLLPIFTKNHKDPEAFRKLTGKSMLFIMSLAIPVFVGGLLMADEGILIVSDDSFNASIFPLRILFGGIFCIFISNLLSHILIGAKLQKKIMFISISGAAINVILNAIMIPLYSFTGAAITTTITETLVMMMYIIQVKRHIGYIPRPSTFIWKVIAATLAMGGVLWLVDDLNTLLQLGAALGTFVGVLLLTSSIDEIQQEYKIDVD